MQRTNKIEYEESDSEQPDLELSQGDLEDLMENSEPKMSKVHSEANITSKHEALKEIGNGGQCEFEQVDEDADMIEMRNSLSQGGDEKMMTFGQYEVQNTKSDNNYLTIKERNEIESNIPGAHFRQDKGMYYKDGKAIVLPQKHIELKPNDFVSRQTKFKTDGVEIYFPFKPYQCQVDFMSRVVKACMNGENALLESPTGTGKTLSLLCATLAWLKQDRETSNPRLALDLPKIIYTSRTHSQLAQVQKELMNTAYNPRSVVVGSRDHLCVHPQIQLLRGHALNQGCKKAQRGIDPCVFFKNRDIAVKNMSWEPMDIEDLHKVGDRMKICPYFANKDRAMGADIIFMPYNYLIDEKIRENFDIEYANSIIIFDEAHNIAQVSEESCSFELKSSQLTTAISELHRLQEERQMNQDRLYESNEEDTQCLVQMTNTFQKFLDFYEAPESEKVSISGDNSKYLKGGDVLTGKSIFSILQKGTQISYLDKISQREIDTNIEDDFDKKWNQAFTNCLTDIGVLSNQSIKPMLEIWFDVIKKIIRVKNKLKNEPKDKLRSDVDDFYVFIFDEEDKEQSFQNKKKKGFNNFQQTERVLGFWCFNAGVGFREIQSLKPRSIILTSGTLSPLNSFQAELQLNFAQRIENPHVINNSQVSINILGQGIQQNKFNFSYQSRENESALRDLGATICQIATLTPGGMLVFFPSYALMQKIYEVWTNSSIIKGIETVKKVFMEPKDPSKYEVTMKRFYKSVFDKSDKKITGAILLGVCRGRISEGLDFSDNAARCVIMIGIPYPQMTDPKVILKKDYLDKRIALKQSDYQTLSGKDWYGQQATRAVNQAIGRVIRHVQDYGSIILMDERFGWSNTKGQISKWLRDRIQVPRNFDEMSLKLTDFFADMKSKNFVAKVDQLAKINVALDDQDRPSKKKAFPNGPAGNISSYSANSGDSEEEEKVGFLNNIYGKKQGGEKQIAKRGNTITKMFERGNEVKKRKLDEIAEPKETDRPSKRIIPKSFKAKQYPSNSGSGGLGFVEDQPQESFKPKIVEINSDDDQFGLKGRSDTEEAKKKVQNLQSYSYKVQKKATFPLAEVQPNTPVPIKPSISQARPESLQRAARRSAEDEKKVKTQELIENIKQLIGQQKLSQMTEAIKDFKNPESKKNPEAFFKTMKGIFFDKQKDISQDPQFGEKMKSLHQLSQTMALSIKEKFQAFLKEISG